MKKVNMIDLILQRLAKIEDSLFCEFPNIDEIREALA